MNLSDLTYKLITGGWRIDRERVKEFRELAEVHAHARRLRLYAGANPGLNRPTPAVLSTPEDFKQAYERIVLIRAARQLEEDQPFFDGILSDFEQYVVGELSYRADTGNPEADAVINEYLEWQFDMADFTQRLDLNKIARLSVRSYKRDGECGFVMVDTGESIKLNYISGDRIGNPMIGANIGPNNYNGIVTDPDTGAPAFYDIFRRIPKMNAYVFQMSVRASDFIHYYNPFRFEQYHGVTDAKNSIENGYDMKQIVDYTKLNIKYRSSQLPYVTNEQGKPRGTGYDEPAASPSGQAPEAFDVAVGDGATQTFLKTGEAIMEYPNDFPNAQFKGLIEELKRDCAVGFKLPLEFCYRSEAGGVVQRFYVNKAEQTFSEEKRWLTRTLLAPYKNRVIQKGIDTGFLDLSKFAGLSESLTRYRGRFQLGRSISVDYKNETTADIAQIDACVLSRQDFARENDRDLEKIRRENKQHMIAIFKDAQEIADASGQTVEFVLPYLQKIFPNAPSGSTGPAAGDDSTDGPPAKKKTAAAA